MSHLRGSLADTTLIDNLWHRWCEDYSRLHAQYESFAVYVSAYINGFTWR